MRRHQPARHGLRGEERGPHVQPHDGVEIIDAHFDEGLRPVHAGIVEEDVVGQRPLHRLLEGGEVGYVDGEPVGRAAPFADRRRACLDLALRARRQRDVGAGLGEGSGSGQADAAPGAGDQRALAVEAERGRGG